MKKVYEALKSALLRGQRAALCTILASSGSSPRGAGARMAVLEDGTCVGTVGGGAVERRAQEQATQLLHSGGACAQVYALTQDDVNSLGMICGGAVRIYYEVFDQARQAEPEAVLRALGGGENAWLLMKLGADGAVETGVYAEHTGLLFGRSALLQALRPHLSGRARYLDGEPALYCEPIARAGTVWIIGGGHVGTALVPVLKSVGFRVGVYDDRAGFARNPFADRTACDSFARLAETVHLSAADFAVVMTPGHQADQTVLEQLLGMELAYLGCIGSRKKAEKTAQYLKERGFSEEKIERIHCPVGLSIGAETPEEIAVSIAAELIRCRAEQRGQ